MQESLSKDPNDRCLRVWKVLIKQAQAPTEKKITYGVLADAAGMPIMPLCFGQKSIIDGVYYYCKRVRIPPLPVLAVNGRTMKPGERYPGFPDSICPDMKHVLEWDWSKVRIPEAEDFAWT